MADVDVYFTGAAGTGNLATIGNWSTGAVPTSDQNVAIDRTSYDLYGTLANDVGNVYVTPGWTGTQFGTLASPVSIVSSGSHVVNIELNPRCYLARLTSSGTITKLRVSGTGAGQIILVGGTYTQSEIYGNALIGSSAVCTTHFGLGGKQKAESGTAFTHLWVDGGCELDSSRDLGTCNADGLVRATDSAASTVVNIGSGGVFNLQSDGTQAAVRTRRGGSFSLDGCKKNVTISALYDHAGSLRCDRTGKGILTTITYIPVGKTV
jgi:predicted Rdx family selenoprotein